MLAFSFFLAAVSLVSANPLSTRAKTSFSGGDITFYEGGLTACGATIDTNSDKTVAVSFHVFDSFPGASGNSNKNPICKTKVKATINGRTQTLLVQDSCEGCKDEDLDLTQAAWDGFGVPRSVGRLAGLKWEFIGVGGGDSGNDNDSPSSSKTTKAATKTATKTATKDAAKTSTTTSTSETASDTPIKAVGGAVDSSSDATTTSEAAAATTTTDDSSSNSGDDSASTSSDSGDDSSSSSSDSGDASASDSSTSGDDSSSADSSSDSNSTTAVSGTADVSACNDAWTACNAKFTGTAEDVASYSCQTEYVDCVDAALASSSKKRSVSLKRHIARSRLESF